MTPVASYCRVSTDSADQANSFASQQRYFAEYISRQPDWELYQTYADEGITGTSTKKRAAFNRMITDAHLGKFRMILTKEVSRFSRNILDTIAYTRELRQLGVGVLFMNDGINTMDPDAELRLSIMGSIAQEESRKTSSRVKSGQTRQMEQGVVFGKSLLGYYVKHGSLTVNPDEAELVKLIFHKYGIEKKGTTTIARELQAAGYHTHTGNAKWSNSHIVKILRNEKYVGDLIQKKTFTPDYLTHIKKYNQGEEPMVVLTNHHEPIIDRTLWDIVQAELGKRNRKRGGESGYSNRYLFSGKIICGECGASFVSRRKKQKDSSYYQYWSCCTAAAEGSRHINIQGREVGCDIGKMLRNELVIDILRQSLASIQIDRKWIVQNITQIVLGAIRAEGQGNAITAGRLAHEIRQLEQKKVDILDAFFSNSISQTDMKLVNDRYNRELSALQARLEAVQDSKNTEETTLTAVQQRVAAIVNGESAGAAFYKKLIDHMVVYRDQRVEVCLHFLPQKWTFTLCKDDPSVPISVSRPFSSG